MCYNCSITKKRLSHAPTLLLIPCRLIPSSVALPTNAQWLHQPTAPRDDKSPSLEAEGPLKQISWKDQVQWREHGMLWVGIACSYHRTAMPGSKGISKCPPPRHSPNLKRSTILGCSAPEGFPRPRGARQDKPQLPVSDFDRCWGSLLAPAVYFPGNSSSEPPHPSQPWSTGQAAPGLALVTTGTNPSVSGHSVCRRKKEFLEPKTSSCFSHQSSSP